MEVRLALFTGGTGFNSTSRTLQRYLLSYADTYQSHHRRSDYVGASIAGPALASGHTRVTYVVPISDDGGSTREILRVFGGPAIGDLRSRLLRLAPVGIRPGGTSGAAFAHLSDVELNRYVRQLLSHRLPSAPVEAAAEWRDIVTGVHPLLRPLLKPVIPAGARTAPADASGSTEATAETRQTKRSAAASPAQAPGKRIRAAGSAVAQDSSADAACDTALDAATVPGALGAASGAAAEAWPGAPPAGTQSHFNCASLPAAASFATERAALVFALLVLFGELVTAHTAAHAASRAAAHAAPGTGESAAPFCFGGGSIGNFVFTALRIHLRSLEHATRLFSDLLMIPDCSSAAPCCLTAGDAAAATGTADPQPRLNVRGAAAALMRSVAAAWAAASCTAALMRGAALPAPAIAAVLYDGSTLVGQCNISHPLLPAATAGADEEAKTAGEGDSAATSAISPADVKALARAPLPSPIRSLFYVGGAVRPESADATDADVHADSPIRVSPASVVACARAVAAVAEADVLVYSMGSLFTSVIPSLVAPGIAPLLAPPTPAQPLRSQRPRPQRRVLVLNGTNDRETRGLRVRGYVRSLARCVAEHTGRGGVHAARVLGGIVTDVIVPFDADTRLHVPSDPGVPGSVGADDAVNVFETPRVLAARLAAASAVASAAAESERTCTTADAAVADDAGLREALSRQRWLSPADMQFLAALGANVVFVPLDCRCPAPAEGQSLLAPAPLAGAAYSLGDSVCAAIPARLLCAALGLPPAVTADLGDGDSDSALAPELGAPAADALELQRYCENCLAEALLALARGGGPRPAK